MCISPGGERAVVTQLWQRQKPQTLKNAVKYSKLKLSCSRVFALCGAYLVRYCCSLYPQILLSMP